MIITPTRSYRSGFYCLRATGVGLCAYKCARVFLRWISLTPLTVRDCTRLCGHIGWFVRTLSSAVRVGVVRHWLCVDCWGLKTGVQ